MNISDAIKISRLKTAAASAYEDFHSMFAGGAGHHLSTHIMPEKARAAARFNATMEKLQQLDPSCPKWERLGQ